MSNNNSKQGFAREFLHGFDGQFDRYVIGYGYNPGGYQPWAKVSRRYYLLTVERMKKQGWIKEAERQGKKFLKLTKKGKVQILLQKMQGVKKPGKDRWDRKWRLAIFDIPESCKNERQHIRRFLKKVGFHCLQKSIYIYPYELASDAVEYLKLSGLDQFIRFLRVDKMDDAKSLLKKFGL